MGVQNKTMTYGSLAAMAFDQICKAIGEDPKNWDGPDITEGDDYKLDWTPKDDVREDYVTLYSDGVWQHYSTPPKEGKITPLHHKTWIKRMTTAGITGAEALFAVELFKKLKERR